MKYLYLFLLLPLVFISQLVVSQPIEIISTQLNTPILTHKNFNPALRLKIINNSNSAISIYKINLSFDGTDDISIVKSVSICGGSKSVLNKKNVYSHSNDINYSLPININYKSEPDSSFLWVSLQLKDSVDLTKLISISCVSVETSIGTISCKELSSCNLRVGVALRQHWQDSIHTSRIPGLVTTNNGTLLAVYDARKNSDDDLQGDIDICLNRSIDGGITWSPMQKVLDMGEFKGLPQKYNGVSDPCILVNRNNGDIFVAGLWMHGVLNPEDGKFIENLSDSSTIWNHQWRKNGSQPGFGIKQSSQFLISKSSDDGISWSEPINITKQVKNKKWWLLAPAPGAGITTFDGTILFPTEGRNDTGLQFSTITWSKDNGKSWHTGNPAYYNTNECMAAQLSDGSIMLNMRHRTNRNKVDGNGRAIAVSSDLGESWTEHSTSRNALIESACQASLYKHYYSANGEEKSMLLFVNPSSISKRNNITLKVSFDDGNTWDEQYWIQLDELQGAGYSCITSIGKDKIGIVYEGSQADLVFQQIKVSEILNKLK